MLLKLHWLIAIPLAVSSAETLPRDPLSCPGFQHFYNLEYDEALAAFEKEAAKDPSSPDLQNHIAQAVIFREMFRSGALESGLVTGGTNSFLKRPKMNLNAADQEQFSKALDRAMELANARIAKDPKDTRALYALGVSYGMRANYNAVVRKAWLDALHDVQAARKLHGQVVAIDPGYVDARLIEGLHDYIIGSLPLGWKFLGGIAGFHGDRARGIRTLKLVTEQGTVDRIDAGMLLAGIYRREKKPAEAIPVLNSLIPRAPRNFLLRMELAEMYGDLGDKARAMAALDEVDQLRRTNAPGYQALSEEKIQAARERLLARLDAKPSRRGQVEEGAGPLTASGQSFLPR